MNQNSEVTTHFGPRGSAAVAVRYRGGDGRFVDTTLGQLIVGDVMSGLPVREFRSYKGRRHYSGWYWAATTGGHVVYESRLELARLLVADHDPAVVGIAAQPFLLEGPDGARTRRHVPDLLLVEKDGRVRVVDVKAASKLDDPAVVAQFAWTRALCGLQGFDFEVWSGADPVLLENLRFLAGYRRGSTVSVELEPLVLEAAASPVGLADLERGLRGRHGRWSVRPVVLNLLWRSRLNADLSARLNGATVVKAVAA